MKLGKEAEAMSMEEIKAVQENARELVSKLAKMDIPDNSPVVYERKTLLAKLSGKWWVFMVGEERTGEKAITIIPYEDFFARVNEMLYYIAHFDGEAAALKMIQRAGVDVEFVREDDATGTDEAPTIN